MRYVYLLPLLLTIVWSYTCNINEYKFALLRNQNYEIHGLWPEHCCNAIRTRWPEFCTQVTFDLAKLEPILPQLRRSWYPTNNQTTQDELMAHEYLKHGSCTSYDIVGYFNTALCLYNKVDMTTCVDEQCLFDFKENEICGLMYNC